MVATARILIVEDDAIVARDLKASLTKMGYFVTGVAAAGEEALEMAGENRPDLVLMDIMFDGDIDGIETAQRMRDRHDVPVIYLTAFGDQATFARAKQTLPLAFVLKPFDPKELYLTIETSLERRRLETDLETSEQRFIALAGVVRDGIVITDAEGGVTFINRVAESLTGFKSNDLKGTDWTQLLAPVDGPRKSREAPWQENSGDKPAELRAKDGTYQIRQIRFGSHRRQEGERKRSRVCLPSLRASYSTGKSSRPAVPLEVAIFAERVRVLYQKAISAIPTNLVTAAILIAVSWGEFDHHTLVAWGAANGILSALRLGLVIVYRRKPRPPGNARQWANAFVAGTVLSGGLWGLSALLFFDPDVLAYRVFVIFILGGLCADRPPARRATCRRSSRSTCRRSCPQRSSCWSAPTRSMWRWA